MSSDETQWLTYRQAADKLGVSPQAVRQKAIRGLWSRAKGNDGQARDAERRWHRYNVNSCGIGDNFQYAARPEKAEDWREKAGRCAQLLLSDFPPKGALGHYRHAAMVNPEWPACCVGIRSPDHGFYCANWHGLSRAQRRCGAWQSRPIGRATQKRWSYGR